MHVPGTRIGTTLRALLFFMTATMSVATAAHSDTGIKVMASVKPVHSLVASVMEGVGEPGLIVEGAASPHGYALKPSQATALQNADVVFWIGHELESFLERPIETIGSRARVVELTESHGLTKLKVREGGAFETHAHEDHDDHEDHDKTAKADDHDDHDKAKTHDEHGHGDGELDMHAWLDPLNAKAMVQEIEEALAAVDPKNAAAYTANAKAVMARLDALVSEVQATVDPAKGRGFIVFHDAYQYFEKRFGLAASGTVTVNPEVAPGAARVAEIQEKVRKLGATCVFAEPQFEPKMVKIVTEGTNARSGVLDPLGAGIADGPELYFELIRGLGRDLAGCLSRAS